MIIFICISIIHFWHAAIRAWLIDFPLYDWNKNGLYARGHVLHWSLFDEKSSCHWLSSGANQEMILEYNHAVRSVRFKSCEVELYWSYYHHRHMQHVWWQKIRSNWWTNNTFLRVIGTTRTVSCSNICLTVLYCDSCIVAYFHQFTRHPRLDKWIIRL